MPDNESKIKIEAEITRIEGVMADPSFWQDKADTLPTELRWLDASL